MELTHAQKESILTWYGYQKFGWVNWDMWQEPSLPIPESWNDYQLGERPFIMPNFNDLNFLIQLVHLKSVRIRYEDNKINHFFIIHTLNKDGTLERSLGVGNSMVDSIHSALLKLIEDKYI